MADTRLSNPVLRVVMADGSVHDHVQTRNTDLIQYDLTRGSQRPPWPAATDAPLLWQTYIAWRALVRERLIDPAMPWAVFREEAVEVSAAATAGGSDESGGGGQVDPTPPAPGAG